MIPTLLLLLLLLISIMFNNIISYNYKIRLNRYKSLSSLSSLLSLRCNYNANIIDCNNDGIVKSALVLKQGGLVAFPTETVYGLGANALNESSVLSIFKAKGRPLTDPLIVHVASKNDIIRLFDFTNSNSNTKNELALTICNILCDAFWPGPLTIIYKASKLIPSCITAGTGRIMIIIIIIIIIITLNIIRFCWCT